MNTCPREEVSKTARHGGPSISYGGAGGGYADCNATRYNRCDPYIPEPDLCDDGRRNIAQDGDQGDIEKRYLF